MNFNRQFKRERKSTNNDKFFVVTLKGKNVSAETGYINSCFDEKDFMKEVLESIPKEEVFLWSDANVVDYKEFDNEHQYLMYKNRGLN